MKTLANTAWADASFDSNLSSIAPSIQKLLRFCSDMSKWLQKYPHDISSVLTISVYKMLWFRYLGAPPDRVEQVNQKYNFWDQAAIFSVETSKIWLNQRQHVREEVMRDEMDFSCDSGFWPLPLPFLITSKRKKLETSAWTQMKHLFKRFLDRLWFVIVEGR